MSDRFYQQQCEFFNIKPAELIHAGRYPEHPDSKKLYAKMERKLGNKTTNSKRKTKADLVEDICLELGCSTITGLDKLVVKDLDLLFTAIQLHSGEFDEVAMPTGRAKKPYTDAIASILNTTANLDKLTVAVCKEFLSVLGVK